MPQPGRERLTAVLLTARLGWGAVLVLRPEAVLSAVGHGGAARWQVGLARVLGARHLAQGVVRVAFPSPRVRRVGSVVDGLHASSALLLAGSSPTWRSVAVADGTLAGLLGAAEL